VADLILVFPLANIPHIQEAIRGFMKRPNSGLLLRMTITDEINSYPKMGCYSKSAAPVPAILPRTPPTRGPSSSPMPMVNV
jgi:hypothetical protein